MIAGLVYNFLPFMVLPIYVALERIDPRVVEAARDLYASTRRRSFRQVVFPLALPGVFAGVLMTFVPASSDYVNSAVLGSSGTTMIGQVIQAQYLRNSELPDGVGPVVRAHGDAVGRHLPLRPGAGHRGRPEGGGAMTTVTRARPGAGRRRRRVAGPAGRSGCCSPTPG